MTTLNGNGVSYGAAGTWYTQLELSDPPATTGTAVNVHVKVNVVFTQSISDTSSTGSFNVNGVTGTFNNVNYNRAGTFTVAEFDTAVGVSYGAWTAIYVSVTLTGIATGGTGPSNIGPGTVNIAPPRTPTAPSPPTVAVNQVTATTAQTYVSAAGAENGSTALDVYYHVRVASTDASLGEKVAGYAGTTWTGLTPATAYEAFARTRNAYGLSGFSAQVTFTTLADVPSAPGTPAASAVTSDSATVAWTAPATNGGSAITSYQLQVSTVNTFATTVYDASANTLTRNLTGLSKITPYYMRARAVNAIGTGAWSATGTFTTLPTVPGPPVITGISSITPTSATVSWSPPVDTGGQTVTAYDVQYSTDPTFATGTVTQSSGSLSNLTPGATYSVRVRGVNASGPGAWSATTSLTTFTTQTGMKVYNGTAWADAPVYAWNGTAWVACEVRIYNGTAWVPTG